MASAAAPDLGEVRSQFRSLEPGFAFFENAGGSQVPHQVVEAVSGFFEYANAQTGAGYPASDRAGEAVQEAHRFADAFMGAGSAGCSALGGSTSGLLAMLGRAMEDRLGPGDEVVVSVANHEANIGPWVRMERCGVQVRWWGLDPGAGAPSLEGLARLLGPRTRVVAFPHTSNLLGDVFPAKAAARMVREAGAWSVVDGVAYAPHRLVDAEGLGVDFYAVSFYKVFGPHLAALYGTHEAWSQLEGPNHFFVPRDEVPRKFELGCLPFELLAGLRAVGEYLAWLAGEAGAGREAAKGAYARIEALEQPVQEVLAGFLAGDPRVRILGAPGPRVPTFSFVPSRVGAETVADYVNARGCGIRHGHMYAYRLCEALGIPPEPGVVRVSAVHYNTEEEARRLVGLLDEAL